MSKLAIKPMVVRDMSFLLEKLHRDCGELQFIRELTQNSIDAISRTSTNEGKIIWDNVTMPNGSRKKTIVDNGCGLTGQEMLTYLNMLSSSGSIQSMDANFGIGGKISALVKNPHGLLYISKTEASSIYYVARVMKIDGEYGAEPYYNDDTGETEYWAIIDDVNSCNIPIHDLLKKSKSGMQVILLGESESDDTTIYNSGPKQWIGKNLNTRYFIFPAGISVHASENTDTWARKQNSANRPLRGQKWALDSSAQDSGIVELTKIRIHWWLLKKQGDTQLNLDKAAEKATTKNIRSKNTMTAYNVTGHVAIIFQNELYDISTGNSGHHKLQQFGIFRGMNRVVLYVEPITKNIFANASRTSVTIEKDQPTWLDWASEFKNNMPNTLREYVDGFESESNNDDNEFVKNKVREILSLNENEEYKKNITGSFEIDENTKSNYQSNKNKKNCIVPRPHPNPIPKPNNKSNSSLFRGLKPGGLKGTKITIEDTPDIHIFRGKDNEFLGQNEIGGKYISNCNRVHINGEFQLFLEIEQRFITEYCKSKIPPVTVTNCVRKYLDRWIKVNVSESILALKSLNNVAQSSINEMLENTEAFRFIFGARVLLIHQLDREVKRELPCEQN